MTETVVFREASQRFGSLCQSVRALLSSAPGGARAETGLDIERAFGVHRKLAWQIHRLCRPGGCVADARFLPSRAQFTSFVRAVVEHGGSREIAPVAEQQYQEIESFIEEQFGSRSGFESMVSEADREAAGDITSKHRKAMYEAASHLYGIRAKARFCCNLVAPSRQDADKLDYIHVDGFVDLQRQRALRAWPVNRLDFRFMDEPGNWRLPQQIETFDERAYRQHGVGIIPAFSSRPLPSFELVRAPSGDTGQILAQFKDMGLRAATTLVFGVVFRHAESRGSKPNVLGSRADFSVSIEVPCETLISDVLVHRSIDLGIPRVVTLRLDADLPTFQVMQMETNALPVDETIVEAGNGIALISHLDMVPGYEAILNGCLDRCGASAEEFRAYRCAIHYPMVSTVVTVRFA